MGVVWRPCCDVVGEVVERGMALAWPRRGEEKRGEQGKRNRKGTGFSAPLARPTYVRPLDSSWILEHGLCNLLFFLSPSEVILGRKKSNYSPQLFL